MKGFVLLIFVLIGGFVYMMYALESDQNKRNLIRENFIEEITHKECTSFGGNFEYYDYESPRKEGTMFLICIDKSKLNDKGQFSYEYKELSVPKSYYYLKKYNEALDENLYRYDKYVNTFNNGAVPNPYDEKADKEEERELLLKIKIEACLNEAFSYDEMRNCLTLSLTGSDQK